MIKKITACEDAATAIEYSLIAALFSIICITAYTQLSDNMLSKYEYIADAVFSASSSP